MKINFLLCAFSAIIFFGIFEQVSAQVMKKTIEFIEVQGNRIYSDEEILSHIQTKNGAEFDEKQVAEDLQTPLALGYFNTKSTRFVTEYFSENRINLIFEVYKLPLIKEIEIDESKYVTEEEISALLKEEKFEIGKPYNHEKSGKIKQKTSDYLIKRGFPDAQVEIYEESLGATKIKIAVVIEELPEIQTNFQ